MDMDILKWPFSKKVRKKYREKCRLNFKLIMTLVVKNEEDIVEQNIRFHCAMGCDGFIVSSHNSTDRTDEILEKLKREGLVLEIIKRTSQNHQHSVWVDEMIHLAKNKYHADWVINADADEFYYSNSLNLKKSILQSEGGNVLWVDSLFIFPEDRDDWLNSSYFVTRPFQKFEAEELGIAGNSLYEEFIGSQGCTKVIHKTHGFVRISDGNHDAKMRFRKKIHSADIRLYHYHIRSYLGWEQKVARWVDSIFLLPDGQGEHMKHMVRLYQTGKLKDEFEHKYGSQMREFLIEQGVVSNDPSVKNFLKYKGII